MINLLAHRPIDDYDCRPAGEHDREVRWTALSYFVSGGAVGFVLAILLGPAG